MEEIMDWNAIGAVGQILSSIITLGVGIIAFTPYMKKCDVAFSFLEDFNKGPILYVINGSQRIRFIKKIQFRSGRFGETFLEISIFEENDDLLISGKKNFFIQPNNYRKYYFNPNRLMYLLMHYEYKLSENNKNKKVYIKADFGFYKTSYIGLGYTTMQFIECLINRSDSYNNQIAESFFEGKNKETH